MIIQKSRAQLLTLLFAVVLGSGIAGPALADSYPEGVMLSETVKVTAKVVGIDRADRTVTLVGPRGNVVEIEAGDEVRNFDQIRVGDEIGITYYESVALYLGAPGSQPEVDVTEVMGRAKKGDKPAGVVLGAIDVSAVVRGVHKSNRALTLEMPDGHTVTSKVDPSLKAFDSLKVGDTIHARVTRALAISVEAL